MIKSVLYAASIMFALLWFIGFFVIGAGALIHTLPVFALLSSLQAIIVVPKSRPEAKI
jgi:hypothetical protein